MERASGPRLSFGVQRVRGGAFAELQARLDALAARGGDLVPLQIGDTVIETPTGAEKAFGSAPELGRYGATTGLLELRRAIARRLARRHGLAVSGEAEVLLGCGATHAIFCAIRAAFDPGDEVLVASPYWPLTHGVLRTAGVEPIEVPLSPRLREDPSLDAGALFAEELSPRTRGIYLITPNNPDGAMLSRAHLLQIAALAEAHDLWVIADEVYADFAFDPSGAPHVSFATLPGMAARTITAGSLSKSHALPGARVGYAAAPAALIEAARRVAVHTVFNVPVGSQRAAIQALAGEELGDGWLASAVERYRKARDAAFEAMAPLAAMGVRCPRSDGGTYLFPDFSPVLRGRPLTALMERAIDRGVLLTPGEACGRGFERHARLCYTAAPLPRVLEGIARLGKAIEDLG